MKKTTVTEPTGHPCDVVDDPLTDVLRSGAQRLLVQAIEAEAFLALMADWKLEDGRARFVRHGHGPERSIQTGIGAVPVQRAKIRDRGAGEADERIRFSSAILPRWARRSPSLEALLPVLYLRGVSTGDFQEALSALLGPDTPNLSPSVLGRLKDRWEVDYTAWQKRDLSGRRFVYVWADGVYLQARMESQAECMLVIIGATPDGKKELLGFQVGFRESAQSWHELQVSLKGKGLTIAPELATGDGALGFWKALDQIFPKTRHQRCTVRPRTCSTEIDPARSRTSARSVSDRRKGIDIFAEKYGRDKAVHCLTKDRDQLLAFFDFPAEHWEHIRTVPKSIQSQVKHDLREVWMAPDRTTAESLLAMARRSTSLPRNTARNTTRRSTA